MKHSDTIIISPSGNFYGSEQVLFDFLTQTGNSYRIFVPYRGRLIEKLSSQKKHRVESFSSIKHLYLHIFFLLISGKAKNVYCNEGAHVRYIKVLARIFKRHKFILHIRILEDANPSRIGRLPKNIFLISISQFVSGFLNGYKQNFLKTFYDPYTPTGNIENMKASAQRPLRAGVIGRLSKTKGLAEIESFADYMESNKLTGIQLHMIGDADDQHEDVKRFIRKAGSYQHATIIFKGFLENKNEIYSSLDVVLHFSKVEPLGRIFFEALDYGLPIVGFNAGGIGELASQLSLEDCMIDTAPGWQENFYNKTLDLKNSIPKYQAAKSKLQQRFSASAYCRSLEEIIL